MNKNIRTRDSIVLLICTIQTIIYTLAFYFLWLNNYHELVYFHRKGNWLLAAVYLFLFVLFTSLYDGFNLGSSKTQDLIFSQCIGTLFSLVCIYIIACLVNKQVIVIIGFLYIAFFIIALVITVNLLTNRLFTHFIPPLNSLYIYTNESSDVLFKINKYQDGYFNITKSFNLDDEVYNPDLLKPYDCIFVSGLNDSLRNKLVNDCYTVGKSIYVVPTYEDIIVQCGLECNLVDTPLLLCNSFGPSQFEKIIKRCFDILFSLLLLIIASPIMLITALAIKLEDGGPVFYKQVRLTRYKRKFNIFKFRSMRVDAEKNGVQFAQANDARITKVGKIIRACRIDELPQLINILNGDMSVVGPRPERPEIQENILKDLPEFDYRLKVKAGLTGFAQVYGKYNTALKDKLLFDLIYIENFSLFLDLKIMFLTFKILFSKESTEGYDEKR